MTAHPLDLIKENDKEMFDNIMASKAAAFKPGALSVKNKLLIALALDASHGAAAGVRNLAKQALEAGATKEEIMDTLRVAYYICGVGCIYTAAQGLDDVFDK